MKKIILSLAALFCFGMLSAQTEVKPDEPKAEITFTSTEHDYGTVEYDANGTCVFEFKNTGKVPLTLIDVKPSCGCTSPDWSREPIKPGEKGKITVKYNTKISGTFSKSVTVISNATNSPVMLHIKGEVKPLQQPTQPAVK